MVLGAVFIFYFFAIANSYIWNFYYDIDDIIQFMRENETLKKEDMNENKYERSREDYNNMNRDKEDMMNTDHEDSSDVDDTGETLPAELYKRQTGQPYERFLRAMYAPVPELQGGWLFMAKRNEKIMDGVEKVDRVKRQNELRKRDQDSENMPTENNVRIESLLRSLLVKQRQK